MTISTLPITAFPQNYSPLACSDAGRVAIEANETNNRQASATRVGVCLAKVADAADVWSSRQADLT